MIFTAVNLMLFEINVNGLSEDIR